MNGTGAYKVPTLIHLDYAGGSKRHSTSRRPLAARGALRADMAKKRRTVKAKAWVKLAPTVMTQVTTLVHDCLGQP